MDNTLLKFMNVIDEEIEAYESLGELYDIKQSILIQGKSDALWDVDAQIITKADNIKALSTKRKEVAGYLGDENYTLSEIIEKAKIADKNIANNLEGKRTKIKLLIKSLSLQEKTNMTLIKHGLIMVGKSMEIFISAFSPHTSHYNKDGKNIESYENHISSIIEEV